MTIYGIPYGNSSLEFELPPGRAARVLAPLRLPAEPDPGRAVEDTLRRAQLRPYDGGECVIAINDRTRPVPHQHLLPPLLAYLAEAGVPPEHTILLIATGTHSVMAPAQFADVVPPEILGRYEVECHDGRDQTRLSFLGETSRSTPVWINTRFVRAAFRIVVGDIEPHQFVGFSGGVKSAAIGLAGMVTVTRNHSMMQQPLSTIGRYEDNPCRQDIEEIGQLIGVHFALNAVLDEDKKIVRVLAGDPQSVMRQGIVEVRRMFQVETDRPFDLMIASPGGHPKDVNLYQSQKALAHAALVTRPGGTIILAAACPEGTGSRIYEEWMSDPAMLTHGAVLERFAREGYRIGPHKAFQISRDASRFCVLLRSEMEPAAVRRFLLNPVLDFDATVWRAAQSLPPGATIGVLPYANATIPAIGSSG
jgi:lactate racemase